jgi:hypothetical protein
MLDKPVVFSKSRNICLCMHIRISWEKRPLASCPPARLSACISVATAQQIFVKFDIGDFMKVCRETPDLVIIVRKSWVLYMKI